MRIKIAMRTRRKALLPRRLFINKSSKSLFGVQIHQADDFIDDILVNDNKYCF